MVACDGRMGSSPLGEEETMRDAVTTTIRDAVADVGAACDDMLRHAPWLAGDARRVRALGDALSLFADLRAAGPAASLREAVARVGREVAATLATPGSVSREALLDVVSQRLLHLELDLADLDGPEAVPHPAWRGRVPTPAAWLGAM